MEKTEIQVKTTQREQVLSGDNIVSIVIAIKDFLMSALDNYRQIRISQNELEMRSLQCKGGEALCQKR